MFFFLSGILCFFPLSTLRPQTAASPAQLVSGAVVLQAEAVGLAHPLLPPPVLLVGTGRDDGLAATLAAQCVRAGTEEQGEAVLLRHALQEAPQGFVAFLPVAAVVGGCRSLGAGHHVLRAQGATLLVQAAVLRCLQTLVLAIHGQRGSWGAAESQLNPFFSLARSLHFYLWTC